MPIQATRRLMAAIVPLLPENTIVYPSEPHPMMAPYLYVLTPKNGAFLFIPAKLPVTQVHDSVYKNLTDLLEPAGVHLNHLSPGRTITVNPDDDLQGLRGTIANFSPHEWHVHVCILKCLGKGHKPLDESDPDQDLSDDLINRQLSSFLFHSESDRLTAEQQRVFFEMLGTSNRVAVRGVAGSGKTLLARALARQYAAEGKRVLLLCHHDELSVQNNEELAGLGIECLTPHALRRSLGSRMVMPERRSLPPAEWAEYLGRVIDRAESWKMPIQYDVMIVDEGQDFHSWPVLQRLIRRQKDGSRPLYVFFDPRQKEGPSLEIPQDLRLLELEVNCRNSLALTRHSSAIIGKEIRSRRGMPEGYPVTREVAHNFNDLMSIGLRTLEQWIREHRAELKQIAVLVHDPRSLLWFDLPEAFQIGSIKVPLVTDGAAWRKGKGVFIGRVNDFRGLEADFVILVLPKSPRTARHYVGASRARIRLKELQMRV